MRPSTSGPPVLMLRNATGGGSIISGTAPAIMVTVSPATIGPIGSTSALSSPQMKKLVSFHGMPSSPPSSPPWSTKRPQVFSVPWLISHSHGFSSDGSWM